MADHDLVIRNARIVDGKGNPAFAGDLAVKGDRIAAIGAVSGSASREIDAAGQVLAPGFIDIHTHYDPQLCWDRLATPSPEHGVTTLIAGNCSVSLAPVRPTDHDLVIRMFGSVEDMESRQLQETIPFNWETFGEYLAELRKSLGPNVGVFLGHANLRFYVMGAAAQERAATDDEIAEMAAIFRQALRDGAFGISFTFTHLDDTGRELPCAYADDRELDALYAVMEDEARGAAEIAPDLGKWSLEQTFDFIDRFGRLALAHGVMSTISPILTIPSMPGRVSTLLDRFQHWQDQGAPLFAQTQTRPLDMLINLTMGSAVLSKFVTFRRILELPVTERIAQLRDPAIRARIDAEIGGSSPVLGIHTVKRSAAPVNQPYIGRRLADVAQERGQSVVMAMIDIALADDLETDFALEGFIHADAKIVADMLQHPIFHVGSADAGAHITQFSGAGDTCYLIEKFVRQEKAFPLERAVQMITSDLAQAWNIADRGELAVGKFADLVIFDPDTISRGEEVWVTDVPGGDGRYVRHPSGVRAVVVNGEVLVENGAYTEARPGKVI